MNVVSMKEMIKWVCKIVLCFSLMAALLNSFHSSLINRMLEPQAVDKSQRQEYTEANEQFTESPELDFNNVFGYLTRGSSHLMRQEYQEAIDDFN